VGERALVGEGGGVDFAILKGILEFHYIELIKYVVWKNSFIDCRLLAFWGRSNRRGLGRVYILAMSRFDILSSQVVGSYSPMSSLPLPAVQYIFALSNTSSNL
jgi:hypothetical protein